MLYPKNNEEKLSKELFKNPTSEYRGTPFFAWNCKVNKEQLLRQIDQLKEMGMGGFHIHSRTGMGVEYLSDEFMDLVKAANAKAKENNMLTWLYDEDRWPSGFAGGYVTKETKYRARFLVFSPKEYEDGSDASSEEFSSTGQAQRSNNRRLIAKYEVILKDGYLSSYKRLKDGENQTSGSKLWFAYIEVAGSSPWFNNQAYVNTLDPEAIRKFVDITHERYYQVMGEEFGKSVPAIFTDEPQFTHKDNLGFSYEERDITIPFTDDFEETFKKVYGDSVLDYLPELFWELPDGRISVARYRYHDHLSERFASAYADTIGEWCDSHGIMLTGHMMEEPTLESQTKALGEAMRAYRAFQLPGIDILCDKREYSTAKQAQSASHQYGCPGVISELYGVTNWGFDFRGHKLQGDWQAALGITVRVQHLAWMSMEGEAKRDYPASIGYQSPWYKEYLLIEDHFSRVNTALTRGKTRVKVGVIHPIESYWLHFGPEEQTAAIRKELDENFNNIIEWLLFGLIDFDFIAESLLPSLAEVREDSTFKVGEMEYDVVIVPNCETLRSSTVERLEAFRRAGGSIIFAGEVANLVDAVTSEKVLKLAENSEVVPFTQTKILQSIEKYRDIDIKDEKGLRADDLIYQMKEDGEGRWVFICHAKKMENPDIASIEKINITVSGIWNPVIYNTMNGETYPCEAMVMGDKTKIKYEFSQHDSILLYLKPGEPQTNSLTKFNEKGVEEEVLLLEAVPITLSEPNALLLDLAEYSFDGGEWQSREELLRIDNLFRKQLGYHLRMEALAQPWVNSENDEPRNKLSLKFTVISDIDVVNPCLALEGSENTEIIVNNIKVSSATDGWYVDECIKKIPIPNLPKGKSEIILNIPFVPKTNVEWCYLLGDFGVKVEGSNARIIEPVRKLVFGDWSQQGLPFYAGNVTYQCELETENCNISVEIPQFRNPVLSVAVDGEEKGKIAFAPYILRLGKLEAGNHTIDITAFGNRINTFGTVHNCNHSTEWFGPNAWRTTGNSWSYEYQLKKMGILTSPRFSIE
ncbi:hypothetical protein LF65_01629 [Clostridium beijerinckii]|uniref:Uncharacterized protein n=1 Tax=Clostridium beijerinckii TaxID=1520 RepID=A0A0B5Q7W2_CLOBE|nr:glycosyl hydrolase [Clostridium beijerinckii]AJG98234.1 hypothetical protein LF65_01629 [Clostridium beijerinckii]